jgi:protein-disulfide isomerase
MYKKEMAPVIPAKEMTVGDANAPVRLELFGDYESKETRAASEAIKVILEKCQATVNFTFRHFPMTRIHQKAHKAAEAAIAAGQEGKFWEMHQQLIDHPYNLGVISLKSYARDIGVSNKRFLEQLMNGDFGWYVQDDIKEGLAMGVREIPVLFINGKRWEKAIEVDLLKKAVDKERKLLTVSIKEKQPRRA